jgi:precorrin-6B C5,15-methyltransferase / cobalt-precorrin-6B C5,C15-methyltransferase
MHTIHVIGLGMGPSGPDPSYAKRIEAAPVLVGGDRLLTRFPDHAGARIRIKSPLSDVIERIRSELASHEVVVLADGDPGFFGIGRRLVEAFGRDAVELYPNVTTLQWAAARLKIPWDDITVVSLHGRREMQSLLNTLVQNDRVGVFTDADRDPARVAADLVHRGVDAFHMYVLEDLCTGSEKMGRFLLEEAAEKTFSPLNFIILERTKMPEVPLRLGLDDDLYVHEKGLITKREIRAASLCALGIGPTHTVWDLGAGCGSLAMESSLLASDGRVLAVEKDPGRVRLVRENIRRTGAYGVEAIHGEMPECLGSLPDPDRVFVGGGMARDRTVLEAAAQRLQPGGRVVLNLVLMGSLCRTMGYFREHKWDVSVTQIQVSRSTTTAGDQRLEALNPVYIVSAQKPGGDPND